MGFPFHLRNTLVATALAAPLGMVWWWPQNAGSPWYWLAGAAWMSGNLVALEGWIRAGLAPPDAVDQPRAVRYALLVLLVLPALLIGLLFGARAADALMAVAAGIGLPLVLVVLRAGGVLLMGEGKPKV